MIPGGMKCKNLINASDAFGTGIHSYYILDYVVSFNVEFRTERKNLRFSDEIVFCVLDCF
jgi:hypothetical protein